ncbi:unnamed protein product [Periconia digitata]|uniref:Uncharacterized protein n=1 Tax=Periconia digitata TaxID=1303443 RepID=A0A9W4UWE2_9PLEO|nr:unnamed protein product [Periconia digitata]
MSDNSVRLPGLAELLSSAPSPALTTATTTTTSPHHQYRPYDPWAPFSAMPARTGTEETCTPSTASWKAADSSPRLAPSPPQSSTRPSFSHQPQPLLPPHQHHQVSSPAQHQIATSPAHHPFAAQPPLESPRHLNLLPSPAPPQSQAQSRTSGHSYADPKAPTHAPITARQDSAVPEPQVSTSQPPQQSKPLQAFAYPAATPRFLHDARPYDAAAHLSRLPSPAPSPENVVSPLSTYTYQRRKTTPPPTIKDPVPHRRRSSSVPKPGFSLLNKLPANHPVVTSSSLLQHANMPPPDQVQQHLRANHLASALQPSAEIKNSSDEFSQHKCSYCGDVWDVDISISSALNLEHTKPYTSSHDMHNFTDSTLNQLHETVIALNEKHRRWRSQHVFRSIDSDGSLPCLAARAAAVAKSNKRKAEAPSDDGIFHSKLRRLSVDSPKASQLTPPPEPGSSSHQPRASHRYVSEPESITIADILSHPSMRPYYEPPPHDARRSPHLAKQDETGSPAPKTPER